MEDVEPKELKEIGERLYGWGWQTRIAEAVSKSPRTVRDWVAGKYPVNETAARLIRLLDKQKAPSTKAPNASKGGVQKPLPLHEREK